MERDREVLVSEPAGGARGAPLPAQPQQDAAALVLALQRRAGNHAVSRMLAGGAAGLTAAASTAPRQAIARTPLDVASLPGLIAGLTGDAAAGATALRALLAPASDKVFVANLNSFFRGIEQESLAERMRQFAVSLLGAALIANGNDPARALDALASSLTGDANAGLAAIRQGGAAPPTAAQAFATLLRMGDDPVDSLRKKGQQVAQQRQVEQAASEAVNAAVTYLRQIGFHTRRDVAAMLAKGDFAAVRGEFAEELAKERIKQQPPYKDNQGIVVMGNIECLRKLTGSETSARTVQEWLAQNTSEADKKRALGMREAEGALWKSETELDLVVVDISSAKPRMLELQQVKSGAGDTGTAAAEQNVKSLRVLAEVAKRNPNYALYERTSKTAVGNNMTNYFDLTSLVDLPTSTLGPRGKTGFTATFAMSAEDMLEVARALASAAAPPPQLSPVGSGNSS